MALRSGLNAQLGFKSESTWGTAVTVDKFVPLVSENIKKDVARIESSGILAGRRMLTTNQYTGGEVTVSGDINMELAQQGIGTLWKWALGAVSTTGAGPYTHTFTPGDLSDDHLTVQVGRPDTGGTVDAFTYSGAKCASWEIAAKVGENVTASFSVVGKDEATNTALVAASFTNGVDKSFTFISGAISIGGTTNNVKEFTFKGDNGLNVDRRFLGSANISEPLEAALREYGGDIGMEWEGFTQYNRFVAGTTATLSAFFSAGSDAQMQVLANIRFDGETPEVAGREVLEQKLPFKAIATSTDAAGLTVTVVNNDTTN